jgi:hypothetical protein
MFVFPENYAPIFCSDDMSLCHKEQQDIIRFVIPFFSIIHGLLGHLKTIFNCLGYTALNYWTVSDGSWKVVKWSWLIWRKWKTLSRDSLSQGRHSKPEPPKHKAGVMIIKQRHSHKVFAPVFPSNFFYSLKIKNIYNSLWIPSNVGFCGKLQLPASLVIVWGCQETTSWSLIIFLLF